MLVVGGESHLYLLASGGNLAEAAADTQPEKKKKQLTRKSKFPPLFALDVKLYHFQGFYQDTWSHKAASLGVVQNGWHWR